MEFHNKVWLLSTLCIVFIVESSETTSTITTINAYSPSTSTTSFSSRAKNRGPELERNSYQISTPAGRSGKVIFDEPDNKRKTRNLLEPNNKDTSSNLAGLQNHRLEEPTLSTEVAAAAVADASQQGEGRTSFVAPNGWASNSGSCLFSCGGFGGNSPCCQLNYVQCCSTEPWGQPFNFKNLHHGRGGMTKSGYAWGSPPYNHPPIVRPKPCQPFPYNPPPIIPNPGFISPPFAGGGGTIIHKGIETLKHGVHNIGQLFKDHVGGGGWTSGGNGAAGAYYFRRRNSDGHYDINSVASQNGIDMQFVPNSSKQKRPTRSIHKGFDQVAPCPVYSAQPVQPAYGWPIAKPQSVGLGSLIGWTKPGNNYHGLGGGAFGYGGQHHHQHGWSSGASYGWGSNPGLALPRYCKWDFDCPGFQKCCKGVCEIPPQHIH